jgi:hypothetical protein
MEQERQLLTMRIYEKYDKLIEETIQKNNRDLNIALEGFIKDLNLKPALFDSQVPTALILTSSESASSIDSQFSSLSQVLTSKVKAKMITLDGKKC